MNRMYNFYRSTKHLLILAATVFVSISCTSESTSLFDPDYQPERPDPVINSISPEGGYLAGVDEVIITGQNFSELESDNRVYFNGLPGIINSASSTELRVRPARQTGKNLPVKLSVLRAINFSNVIEYDLDQAVFQAPGSIPNDNVLGIATDVEGNIFFSYQEGGAPRGIRKWSTDGTVEHYLPSQFNWNSLKVGPDGLIYSARDIRAIYRETEGGTIDNNPFAIGNQGEFFVDMDFDVDGFLWTVGDNSVIFRVNIDDGSIERFPFDANLRAVRYYEGKLYLGGSFPDGSEEGSFEIWTVDVSNGQISNPQQFLNVSSLIEDDFRIFALTFDENGQIYIGTDIGTGIFTWTEADGIKEFYPGLIEPTGYSFAWHNEFLIASATNLGENTRYALKIDVRRQGAPYFGIE